MLAGSCGSSLLGSCAISGDGSCGGSGTCGNDSGIEGRLGVDGGVALVLGEGRVGVTVPPPPVDAAADMCC